MSSRTIWLTDVCVLVKLESATPILPHVGKREHILNTSRHTNLPNNWREHLKKEMRKSSLDVKHTTTHKEEGNPLINVMISHTSRAEARQSGKSYQQWIAHWPVPPIQKTSVHPHQTENTMEHHRSRHRHLNMTSSPNKQTHRSHGEPARRFHRTVPQTHPVNKSFPGLKTHHTDHGDVHRNQQWAQQPTRQDVWCQRHHLQTNKTHDATRTHGW